MLDDRLSGHHELSRRGCFVLVSWITGSVVPVAVPSPCLFLSSSLPAPLRFRAALRLPTPSLRQPVFPQGRDPTQSLGKGRREPSIPFCRGSRSSSVCTCMDVRSSRLGSAAASGLQTCPGGWVAHSAHQGLVSRRVNKSIGWALSPRQPQLLPNLSAAQSVCIC